MNVELHKRFLANLKSRRRELGYTQAKVAELLGIEQPSYAAIESGRRNPGLDVVDKVASVLDCDPAELLAKPQQKIPA